MPASPPADLTGLLNRMFRGDEEAGNQALEALYTSLRKIAGSRLRRERPGHILDTRALINEAMLRLFGTRSVTVQNRQHFLALACLLMKRILIEAGRRHDPIFVSLELSTAALDPGDRDTAIAIDRILARFGRLDPEALQAIQLKVGAGMTSQEIAEQLSVSAPTVNRSLKRAKEWLFKELQPLVAIR